MNRIIAISGTIIVLAAGALIFFEEGYIRFNYPSSKKYPVHGIDISHHQDSIDWGILKRADIDFIFIKATEGGDHKDTKFTEYWKRAGELGLTRGAYHYFTFCKSGREQAMNYIAAVPAEAGLLPPVIDLEYGGNCSARPSKEALQKEIGEFSDIVERTYGKRPLIYTTKQSYTDFVSEALPGYMIWIRDIYSTPRLPDGRGWSFWQYTNKGRLWGIAGFVDLDVFNGTREEFAELLTRN
ncbi:MAG: GH25 family lysozyme [Thermodesulfobacteriota bacterium]